MEAALETPESMQTGDAPVVDIAASVFVADDSTEPVPAQDAESQGIASASADAVAAVHADVGADQTATSEIAFGPGLDSDASPDAPLPPAVEQPLDSQSSRSSRSSAVKVRQGDAAAVAMLQVPPHGSRSARDHQGRLFLVPDIDAPDSDRGKEVAAASPLQMSTSFQTLQPARRRSCCCFGHYNLTRLRNSMVMTLLNIYHAYNLFAATVIGFALGINLLMSWFIEWFQYSAGRQDGLSDMPLGKFLAVVLRSCMLIQLLCQLLRASIWLLQDALRVDSFQLYRCLILGGAVKSFRGYKTDALSHLGAPGGWTYNGEKMGKRDVLAQLFIYGTFDFVPIGAALVTYKQTQDASETLAMFWIYACGVAILHVVTFHCAMIVNDVAAKGYAWADFWREHRPQAESLLQRSSWHESEPGSFQMTPTQSSFQMMQRSDGSQDDAEEAPWNICVLLCGCIEALGKALLQTAAVVCVFLFCLYRIIKNKDPIPMSILAAGVVAFLLLLCVRYCSRRASKQAPRQAPRDWPRARRFWNRLQAAQRWGDHHCGLAEAGAAAQYDVYAFIVILHIALFWYVTWWKGIMTMAAILSLVVLRRSTLALTKPLSWLIGFLEAIAVVGLSVALNYIYFNYWYAVGTFILCMGIQFTLARQHPEKWRFFVWVSFALQLSLTIIIAVSMFMLLQEDDSFSYFCNPKDPGCQYFSTSDIEVPPIQEQYMFCDMRFPLTRPAHHGLGDVTSSGCSRGNGSRCLSLQQFAMLSALAYESNVKESLGSWFPDGGWQIVYERRVGKISAKGGLHQDWTTFFELADPSNETTIFVIRGTQTPLDIMQDLNIWSPIAIAQLAGMFGPDLSTTAARSVLVFSTVMYGQWIQKDYYANFLSHVKTRIKAEPDRRYYLTGHSLGGGLAKLVGAETLVTSITFSSPGLRSTSILLQDKVKQAEAQERLHRLSYTVVPDNDIVPRVDTQVGTAFHVGCRQGPLGCHSIGETLCELITHCGGIGDDGGEPVKANCELCPAHSGAYKGCGGSGDNSARGDEVKPVLT